MFSKRKERPMKNLSISIPAKVEAEPPMVCQEVQEVDQFSKTSSVSYIERVSAGASEGGNLCEGMAAKPRLAKPETRQNTGLWAQVFASYWQNGEENRSESLLKPK